MCIDLFTHLTCVSWVSTLTVTILGLGIQHWTRQANGILFTGNLHSSWERTCKSVWPGQIESIKEMVVAWNYIGAGQCRAFNSRLFEFHDGLLMLLFKLANGLWGSIETFLTRVTMYRTAIWPLRVIINNGAADEGWLKEKRKWYIHGGSNSSFGFRLILVVGIWRSYLISLNVGFFICKINPNLYTCYKD